MEGTQVSYPLRSRRRPINVVHVASAGGGITQTHSTVKTTYPLKRQNGVKRGKCSELPRTPAKAKKEKLKTPKRSSAIKQRKVHVQCNEADTPTSVVIKTNPLFIQSSPLAHQEKGVADENYKEEFPGYHKVYCDPLRQRQRKKTKDYEMINAILELSKYGEKRYSQKNSKAQILKAKFLGRRRSSEVTSPNRHARSSLSSKDLRQNLCDFYP